MEIWARATAICGTLDIVYACGASVLRGAKPPLEAVLGVLQSVAAGPFGDGMANGGWATALLGLVTHFAIMSVMVAFYLAVARTGRLNRVHPAVAGTIYGLILYGVMYCVVLTLRYPANFPQTDPVKIAIALFPHIFLVGIPLAYMAVRRKRLRP